MRIVGGEWSGRRIAAPPGRQTRPTTDRVREAWMSAVAEWLDGAAVLDLFAGSGALGIEALSRGAERATFVESAPAALRVLKQNLADLDVPRESATLVRTDALRYAERLGPHAFDVAFADPPYGVGYPERLAEIFERTHFARLLCVEHARSEPLAAGPGRRERRYGDTLLTFLSADDDE